MEIHVICSKCKVALCVIGSDYLLNCHWVERKRDIFINCDETTYYVVLGTHHGFFVLVEKWLFVELYGLQRERDIWKFGLYLLFFAEKRIYYIWRITLISIFFFSQVPTDNICCEMFSFKYLLYCVTGA